MKMDFQAGQNNPQIFFMVSFDASENKHSTSASFELAWISLTTFSNWTN